MNMFRAIITIQVLFVCIAIGVAVFYGPDLAASIGDFGSGIVARMDHAIGYPGK